MLPPTADYWGRPSLAGRLLHAFAYTAVRLAALETWVTTRVAELPSLARGVAASVNRSGGLGRARLAPAGRLGHRERSA
jgi:hypothetical protein